ncbi:MAG: hypothetical protein M3O70_21430 [Actinomycetota bacterium]|nr:hypothetical protein [Actinomycetota bacterium]
MHALGLTWNEAGLVVITATSTYAAMLILSRIFGQRQFTTATTYDLAFIFAIGSLMGRVILVRTSLGAAVLGLVMMFSLHAATGWLHHHVPTFHRITQNRPILLALEGEVLEDALRDAHTSRLEVYEAIRLQGLAALEDSFAVVLERSGQLSVIRRRGTVQEEFWREVAGAERLLQRNNDAG